MKKQRSIREIIDDTEIDAIAALEEAIAATEECAKEQEENTRKS